MLRLTNCILIMENHSFSVAIAASIGLKNAIILQHFVYWWKTNLSNGKNFHEGNYWTYNSREAFSAVFPYFSPREIQLICDKLQKEGFIEIGCFNKLKLDRTLWYTITQKTYVLFELDKTLPILQNVKCNLHLVKWIKQNVTTIPDINTYINTKKEGEQAPPTDFFLLIEEKYFNLTNDKQFAETRGAEFRKMEITINEDYIQNQLTDKVIKAEYRQYRSGIEKQEKQEIEIPQTLNTSDFIENWQILIATPKWKKKEADALKTALKQLSSFDVNFACELVQCAIAGNWQGVVFLDTKERYEKWKMAKQAMPKVMSAMERHELSKKVDYEVDKTNFF